MEASIKQLLLSLALLFPALCCKAEGNEAYDELFKDKDTITEKGILTVHKTTDKIYLEIPSRLFGRQFLSGTIVTASNNPMEAPAGYCPTKPVHFFFEAENGKLMMKRFRKGKLDSPDEKISKALENSHIPAIIESFKIEAWNPDSTAAVIDASSFFLNDGKAYNPIDPQAYNSLDGYIKRDGSYLGSNSFISEIQAFPDNIAVTSTVSYKVKSALLGVFKSEKDIYLTTDIRHSMVLMPEHRMFPVPADPRSGTSTVHHSRYDASQNGMETLEFATKWDLENGPITFYIDDKFPETWIPYIEESLDAWNTAFEKAGCPDALHHCLYSEAGEEFNEADIMNTCIRYIPSPSGKILDNKWTDPTTGQILRAEICINHGIKAKIQKDLLLQTGGADPAFRTLELDDKTFGNALKSVLLRNIGHCLGLEDNLAGSRAFPVDSLRSPEFTREYGISASAMDILPFNFIAGPEDAAAGTVMMQERPGIYDEFALRCLYGLEAADWEEDRETLRKTLNAKAGDPRYHFGKTQSKKAFFDPRAMVLDLGDNSMEAAKRGFLGLQRLVGHASEWLDDEDLDYSYRQELYDEIVNLSYEYVKQVFVNVGGIFVNEKMPGAAIPSYIAVPKKLQRGFLNWIMRQLSDFSWMENSRLSQDVGLSGSIGEFCQKYYSRFIFSQIGEMWVSESCSADPYTQLEAMEDVAEYVWRDVRSGKEPEDLTKFQQDLFIDYLTMWSQDDGNAAGSAQVRYKTAPVRAHEWYSMLLDTEKLLCKAERRAQDEKTRNHYRYLHWKINKVLK